MRRLLRNYAIVKSKTSRYYHYDTAGKSLMGSPLEQPAPPAYKMGNQWDTIPEIYQGFRVHEFNPYTTQAVGLYDNWEYSYYGEWWNIGSLFTNLCWVVLPIGFMILHQVQNDHAEARKDYSCRKYTDGSGFIKYQYYYEDAATKL